MTAKTLALSTRQWRVLLNDNLDVLKAAVQSTDVINEDGLKQFHAQLDDMKMLAVAWFQVGVPAPVVDESKSPDVFNTGIVGPGTKKRRGRPTNAERAAAAQAVQ